MASAQIYYPRSLVFLRGVVAGENFETHAVPHHCTVVRKPHKQAGEAEIIFQQSALPFDPRQIDDLAAVLFIGDAGSIDGPVQREEAIRFVGVVDDQDVTYGDEGSSVKLRFRDLSQPAREKKRLRPTQLPRYSDTLEQAIRKAIDAVPGWSDQVQLRRTPELLGATLSRAAGPRGRGGFLPFQNNDPSAWEVIEVAAALCGLIVNIDLRDIVVRAPRAAYGAPGSAESDPAEAVFEFGTQNANLLSVSQHKRFERHRRGVRVVSYDAATRSTITADWPSDGNLPPRRKGRPVWAAAARRAATSRPGVPPPPDRDEFVVSGLQTYDAALAVAQRIWAERAAQEIDGELSCPVPSDQHLGLKNGSRIRIRIRPDLEEALARTGNDEQAAVAFLRKELLMTEAAARLLIRARRSRPSDLYYVDTVTIGHGNEGDTTVQIKYINLIEVSISGRTT